VVGVDGTAWGVSLVAETQRRGSRSEAVFKNADLKFKEDIWQFSNSLRDSSQWRAAQSMPAELTLSIIEAEGELADASLQQGGAIVLRPGWLQLFQQRLQQRQRRRTVRHAHSRRQVAAIAFEALEERTLLSAATVFLSGSLQIQTDSNESVTVQVNPTNSAQVQILINNAPAVGAPSLLTTQVTSLVINSGDAENVIDLSGLTTTAFPNLTSITVNSGNGDDFITGSPDIGDVIDSGHGDDTVNGQGGDDNLNGGNGNDVINGGSGNDVITAGDGTDNVLGDAGHDTILAGDGNDSILGGTGDDSITGDDGLDTLNGEAGQDFIVGNAGVDSLSGGSENDTLFGGAGNDVISGDDGDDWATGNGGQDAIDGGADNDKLEGGDGLDSLNGNAGNDSVFGGLGNDQIEGGTENDYILGGGGRDTVFDENIAVTTTAATNTSTDTIFGNSGDDTIFAQTGNDSVDGGFGNDLVDMRRVTLSVNDVQVTEGTGGTTTLTFTVALSSAFPQQVTVDYATSSDGTNTGGTAIAGTDYTATSGTLTFAPGQTSQTVSVSVTGDSADESDAETFFLNLIGATNATIFDGLGEGRIFDDDAATGGVLNVDIVLLLDDTASFSTTGPVITSVFQNVITDLTTNFPGSDLAFGVARFEAYTSGGIFGSNELPFILNQPVISTTTPNFNQAITAALNRTSPAGGIGAEPVWEALFQIATGNGFDGNGNGNTTENGPAGLVTTQTTSNATGDVPAYSTFTPDPTGPVIAPSVPVASSTDGIGFRPGSQHIVLVASDSGSLVHQTDTATTYTGFGGITIPASTFPAGNAIATPNNAGATIQPTIDALLADEIKVIGLGESFFGGATTSPRADLTALALLTNAINQGTTTIESGITPGPSADDIAPGQPLYFNIDSNDPASLQNSIVEAVTGAVTPVTPPPPPPPAPPPPPVAAGPQDDTVAGADGDDTIFASDSNDLLVGSAGSDVINGGGGNDTVYGGAGNDSINGQAGDDSLFGNGGIDTIDGGENDDVLNWRGEADGSDSLNSSDGFDAVVISGDAGAETFSVTGSGSDLLITEGAATLTIDSSIRDVTLNGGDGADIITVGDISLVGLSALTINGGDGNDFLNGTNSGSGSVRLFLNGDAGDDGIRGGAGRDTITGGAGIDNILGNDGDDSIRGGDDDDVIDAGAGNDVMSGDLGNDNITAGIGDDIATGDDGNDSLDGQDGNDTLDGGLGNDVAIGSAGSDSVSGSLGNDMVIGGAGNDTVDGGRNDDTLQGNSGDDLLRGDHGSDLINGGAGNDTINAGDGDDTVNSGDGNDLVSGADGNDSLLGQLGRDTLIGGDGNDILVGGGSNDTLLGQQGDDVLKGNGGTDTGAGGEGVDNDLASVEASIENIDEAFVLSTTLLLALS